MIMKRLVVIFQSTHSAIKAEGLCLQAGISCRTIPVPRQISSDCGIALEIDDVDKEKVERLFDKNTIDCEFASPLK